MALSIPRTLNRVQEMRIVVNALFSDSVLSSPCQEMVQWVSRCRVPRSEIGSADSAVSRAVTESPLRLPGLVSLEDASLRRAGGRPPLQGLDASRPVLGPLMLLPLSLSAAAVLRPPPRRQRVRHPPQKRHGSELPEPMASD